MERDAQPPGEYPLLEAAVGGKRVIVVADKARDFAVSNPDTDVLVRFNSDPHPADIWVCSFSGFPSPILPRTAKLVVGIIPHAKIALPDFGVETDFVSTCYDQYDAGAAPREIVRLVHWYALCEEMPIWPTSGAVFLDMLLSTSFRECQILGLDFFRSRVGTVELREGRWMGSMHDIVEYICWFERRVLPDRRVKFEGSELIASTKEAWARWMIAEQYKRQRRL